jgi:ADP-ribose pyrophosphatase
MHDHLRRGHVRRMRRRLAVSGPQHRPDNQAIPLCGEAGDLGDAEGGMHAGESREEAAQRELAEEIGYRAGKLTWLSSFHTSKSVVDETAHLFLGEELCKVEVPPDETEFIEVRPFAFEEVLQMVLRSEITDSMTVIGVLHAARLLGL